MNYEYFACKLKVIMFNLIRILSNKMLKISKYKLTNNIQHYKKKLLSPPLGILSNFKMNNFNRN
jgi:hypothetical protein